MGRPARSETSPPPKLASLATAVHGLATLLGGVAALGVMGLLAISAVDVVNRQLRGSSLRGTVEYGEVLLVLVTLLSLATAHRHGAHVSVDFVVHRLPRRASAALQVVGLLAVIVTMCVLVVTGTRVALDSLSSAEYRIGVVRVPLWPARIALAAGFATLTLELFVDLLRQVATLFGRSSSEPTADTREAVAADDPAPLYQ